MTDIDPQADLVAKLAPGDPGRSHGDRSAVLSSVQNVNYPLAAAADFGAVLCHITRRRGCRRAAGPPKLRKVREISASRQLSSGDEWNDDDSLGPASRRRCPGWGRSRRQPGWGRRSP